MAIRSGFIRAERKSKNFGELNAYLQQGPFRDICLQFLRHEGCQGRLPLKVAASGTWWGLNPRLRQQQSIDLVLGDAAKEKVLLAACLWDDSRDAEQELSELRAKREQFAEYDNCYYALLSREPFSEKLVRQAQEDKHILLYTMQDLLAEAEQS